MTQLDSALRMMSRSIRVRVDLGTLLEAALAGVKRVLTNHPGEIGVSIEIHRPAEFAALEVGGGQAAGQAHGRAGHAPRSRDRTGDGPAVALRLKR